MTATTYTDTFDLIDNADEETLSKMDMDRLVKDASYCKTQLICLNNNIEYSLKHQNAINGIDEFISNQSIVDVILACGSYSDYRYDYFAEADEWFLIIPFIKNKILLLIQDNHLTIRHERNNEEFNLLLN